MENILFKERSSSLKENVHSYLLKSVHRYLLKTVHSYLRKKRHCYLPFTERYMFQLTHNVHDRLRSQNVTLNRGQYVKYLPYAFTEHGILMLSSVLKSQRADKVNMLIIDTFVKIRELMFQNKDVVHQLELVQKKLTEHDSQLKVILDYLNHLERAEKAEIEQKNRPRIGFKP